MQPFLKAGEFFSGCEILGLCGRGAFGITYLARNPIGQKIAIKVVTAESRPERELKGLRNYMQVSGGHPNLLRVLHIGTTENGFFYIMEAADDCGKNGVYEPATLENLFRNGITFSPEKAIAITRELLSGIQTLHHANLIHRDIKPDNIIFVNGTAKLSDPGLVIKVGQSASFAGTLGFIPPEALDGENSSQLGDLYAIGKVFYCMLTGFPPKRYPELPADMRIEVCRQIRLPLMRMCSQKPSRRFQTAEEFLAGLPAELEQPTRLDRFREGFRRWKVLHREIWLRIRIGFAAVLLLLTAGGAVLHVLHQRQQEKMLSLRRKADQFLALKQDREELTVFQLEAYLPEKLPEYRRLDRLRERAYKAGKWEQAVELGRKQSLHLRSAAEELIPKLPKQIGNFHDELIATGKMHGFLAAPLAKYLKKETRDKLNKTLKERRIKIYAGWTGLRCGINHDEIQYFATPRIFVPPGAVKMRHSGEIVKIPYPFWIGRNEVTHDDFNLLLEIAPQRSPNANTPVERVTWNDILLYCFIKTRQWQESKLLPPGFIVRPPTEAEWEYAAGNAWLGPDRTPFPERAVFRDNSRGRTWPPGTRKPSLLGTYDMYGNVSEIVQPFRKPKMQNAVVIRGGSFRSKEAQCFEQRPRLAYQNIPDDSGFRIAVAPGSMDYFDRHFFLGEAQQARIDGKVYELFGENTGLFNWERSQKICFLLGGHLAEIPSQDLHRKIKAEIPLTGGSWITFVGGWKVNGEWRWSRSGEKISYGSWKSTKAGGTRLLLHEDKWEPVTQEALGPVFLCEWDEKEYEHRNRQLRSGKKLPLELRRFTVGNRTFMLINSRMSWYTACRVCERLGGRLACLDSPELRTRVQAELQDFRHNKILLGGYAKRKKWFWLSGAEAPMPEEKDVDFVIQCRNTNFIALKDGKFWNCRKGRMILCEWPADSPAAPLVRK